METILNKHRRRFLGTCVVCGAYPAFAVEKKNYNQHLNAGPMGFHWRHHGSRLYGALSGPTAGWLAVGFNDRSELRGTRFVIASLSNSTLMAEVHIAQVPNHTRVEKLGGKSDLEILSADQNSARTIVEFSLPRTTKDKYNIDLSPGSGIYLMLAYSASPDFQHHSAWREHFEITI